MTTIGTNRRITEQPQVRMHYHSDGLTLTDTSVTDALGTTTLDDLADPQPQHPLRLADASPLMERLWRIALCDIESNIVETDKGRFFGAGTSFGSIVYTRDISYAGILGLNRLYPDIMEASLKHTRRVRRRMGFTVSRGHAVPRIDVDWNEEELSERELVSKYGTNGYTRRTDDVIWLWAAGELYERHGTHDDWQWVYDTGREFFERFYTPFFDPTDGLYRGQASFVDIHFAEHKSTGYPPQWSIGDCVMGKAVSTNCLYLIGMQVMARACEKIGRHSEVAQWQAHAADLRRAITTHLRLPSGTYLYLRDRDGAVQPRRHALGEALLVLSGAAEGIDAERALTGYPISGFGMPLFDPFFEQDTFYHNNSSWPFVDTLYLKALECASGGTHAARNAALLARTCRRDGGFHEVVDMRDGSVCGSGSQLWSAAAFVDVCLRAGLVK